MINILIKNGFEYKVKHVAYDHMSHAMITRVSPAIRLVFGSELRHPKECGTERNEMEKELLDWVRAI